MDVLRDHGIDSPTFAAHGIAMISYFISLAVDGTGTFQVRPHKDFNPMKGRDRLLSLQLLSQLPTDELDSNSASDQQSTSEPRNAYDFMRRRRDVTGNPISQRWNASVRLANFATVEGSPLCVWSTASIESIRLIPIAQLGSIGSLLDHLARVRAVGDLDDEGVIALEVRNIEALPLQNVMRINADALFSLQIFEDENHASIHSDKTKEGLSLFGILNNTKTTLGRSLMREWFLRPSMSLEVINSRHIAVECFLRPDNLTTMNTMHAHLKGTKNVPRILGLMKSGKAKTSDWQSLVKVRYPHMPCRSIQNSLSLRSTLSCSGIIYRSSTMQVKWI